MKKAIAAAVLLGVLLFLGLAASPACLPSLSEALHTLALTEDQTAYAAENRESVSWIYGIDGSGAVQSAYMDAEGGQILLLSAFENDVYFVRASRSSESWELCLLQDAGAEVIFSSTRDYPSPPSSVSVSDSGIDLTFLDGESVRVCRVSGKGEPVELMAVDTQGAAVTAAYADGKLYTLMTDGTICAYSAAGAADAQGLGGFSLLSVSQGSVWAYRQETGSACVGASAVRTGIGDALSSGAVLCGAHTGSGSAVLAVENGKTVLVRSGAQVVRQSPSVSLRFRLVFKFPLLLAAMGGYAVCAVLLLLTVFLCKKTKRLAARVTVCCACLFLFAAGIAGLLSVSLSAQADEESLLAQAQAAGQLRAGSMENLAVTESIAGSDAEDSVLSLLDAVSAGQNGELQYDSVLLTTEGDSVLLSRQSPAGAPARAVLGAEPGAFAEDSAGTGEAAQAVFRSGTLSAVDVRPVYRYGSESALLVTRVSRTAGGADWLGSFLVPVLAAFAAILAVAALSFTMLRPLRQMTRRMRAVSEGDFVMPAMRTASDEVGEMWQSLREMAVALRIKDYETSATVRSFYRFVPRGLDKLLDRASIMETSLGDMANVSGTVAVLSIQNREDMRQRLDDDGFMSFLNDSYSVVDRQLTEHEGFLLSSGFDLEGLDLLFRESSDQGLSFSLGLLGEVNGMAREQAPDFFLFLHSTTFLYGLVGTEQRNFSLLSSSELSFLKTLSPKFRRTGVRIAATETCLHSMAKPCASRYIGFVSSEDGKYTYKLHQILEGCSDMEKSLCLSYDDKFQKAIGLFCQNDFYLARNLFSAVLKLNPADGIARWYLFACEHYFNNSEPGGEVYSLFGIED